MKKCFLPSIIGCVVVCMIMLSGCVTSEHSMKKKVDAEFQAMVDEKNDMNRYLTQRIDIWTLDDALVKFGPNPSIAYGDTIIICIWRFYESHWEDVDIGGVLSCMPFPVLRSKTRYYQLTFDKEKKVMIHYKFWTEYA